MKIAKLLSKHLVQRLSPNNLILEFSEKADWQNISINNIFGVH